MCNPTQTVVRAGLWVVWCSYPSITWHRGQGVAHTYDPLVDAHPQGLQGIDEALLVCHGPVAEAADVVLVQSQHGKTLADPPCQLHHTQDAWLHYCNSAFKICCQHQSAHAYSWMKRSMGLVALLVMVYCTWRCVLRDNKLWMCDTKAAC